MDTKEILIRLLISTFISGIIGFDREFKNRPAGIRTHILVCIGATLIAIIQSEIANDAVELVTLHPELKPVIRTEQARLIAQVVSGVGFLGAGTIIVTKREIRGLTTAASLWAVAGLGISIGMGYYEAGLLSFIVIAIVLSFFNKIIKIQTLKKIEISFVHKLPSKEFITHYFEQHQVEVKDVDFQVDIVGEQRIYTYVYTISFPRKLSYQQIVEDLSLYENMRRVRLISV
ncbi:MgtC/SapB family protein [Atopobacter phocae]|uniref:MgtC/SapB family protein n=1 Tax=Atopobacter phocae TaxID=136492 RepID=UPI00046FA603|nr:MgtC/SapB family protein [Atopobacter phocae]